MQIGAFAIDRTEVTIGQFKEFSAGASYRTEAERAVEPKTYLNPGYVVSDYLPATFITWNDATAYCQWLSTKENASYRLPDEAEWEYACRAGATTQYSFGDDMSLLAQYAWHHGNPSRTPHPVGTRLPNHFGLFDMHGSVREWCGDVYDEKRYEKTRYETTSSSDPIGPAGGSQRVNRGGYWNSIASTCRSAFRYSYPPSTRYDNQGFRIVRVLDAPASVHSQ